MKEAKMNTSRDNFNTRVSKGNLHVRLSGEFCKGTAMAVTRHISKEYTGRGNIFIHTHEVTEVAPQSQSIFENMLGVLDLPKENIYLMGEKGKAICHDQGRVLVRKKQHGQGSCGRCKNCKCGSRAKDRAN